ncbi:MAG: APC family permease, partial [Candidatus Thermoplasmatota archaeon]|nr:APC family permease [Candidatus Thermoplasmatota archaeon]
MAKHLKRDLGLFAVIAISVGAMIGSGIFILPALAIPITGPSVILAYILAGLVVLPAALAKSEMATAMPRSGGTYLYIDRAMGPMMGTVAGIGTWFALTFKSALALIGGAPYIVLLLDVPVKALALGIGAVLVVVNIVGVKQTGWLQTGVVTAMVLALLGFIYSGVTWVEADQYHPFVTKGASGLMAATGLVFVSYAGVTKIASVAEEVERPGRNIPLGMLASLGFTALLYAVIVYIMVGVTDTGTIAGSATPMAD